MQHRKLRPLPLQKHSISHSGSNMVVVRLTEDDPTLESVREKLREIERNQKPRNYLGASSVGHPCERKTWYSYHMPHLRKPMEDKGHLATQCGHRAEDTMAAYLRLVDGVELVTHGDDDKQIGFADLGGKFSGHIDGMIRGLLQAPKTVHVWEHKDCNHKKFADFQNLKTRHGEKATLQEWDIVFYGQAQIYMHYMDVTRHYLTVSLSGVRDFDSCRTEYDKEYAKMLIDRADRIIRAKEPLIGISQKKDFYMCRWCDYAEECHGSN